MKSSQRGISGLLENEWPLLLSSITFNAYDFAVVNIISKHDHICVGAHKCSSWSGTLASFSRLFNVDFRKLITFVITQHIKRLAHPGM